MIHFHELIKFHWGIELEKEMFETLSVGAKLAWVWERRMPPLSPSPPLSDKIKSKGRA